MPSQSEDASPSNEVLLNVCLGAVAVSLVSALALNLKGHQWAREASLVGPLTAEAQRNELALKSLVLEAYQWNQTHPTPALTDFLRRLNVTVQTAPAPAAPSPNPAPKR